MHNPLILDLPPKSLHPNSRSNWKAKVRDKSKYRDNSAQLAWGHLADQLRGERPMWSRAVVQLHFVLPVPRGGGVNKNDPDNLIAWAKTAIDALQDAGMIADDRELIYLPPKQSNDAIRPRLEILCVPGTIDFSIDNVRPLAS